MQVPNQADADDRRYGCAHSKVSIHFVYLNFLGVPLNSRPRYDAPIATVLDIP